ncbi:DNA-directed RNA polymerase I subunit RPA43 [Phyllobates terribilis]|uniref:DNA-directed RNA polymerase I subunit RPA43 n=1 Tax=Phyllobates terribilis TaxID=111132 RepID=UPI003CCB20E1
MELWVRLRHHPGPSVRQPCGRYSMAAPDNPGDSAADVSEKLAALCCLTLPSFSEACGFIHSKYSCLAVKTHRRHIALSPKYMSKKRSGITEHLTAELLKYNVVLEGVPVAYDNIKLIGELGDIYDDIGYIHINIEADFVVFQPQYGEKLVGVVNKKAPSHIGCLVHGCFNASIPRPMKMAVEAWQHVDVNVGDQLEFEVFRLDSDAVGVLCIRGRLSRIMEAEAIKKMNAMSEEQNANTSLVKNGSEITEEGAVEEMTVTSRETSKSKGKKRSYEETFTHNEYSDNQQNTNLSLEEAPKKKRKKHKHHEIFSQDLFIEIDGNVDDSIMEPSLQLHTKKKKHRDSLQNIDNDVAVDSVVIGSDSTSVVSYQEHKAKKSKKKKQTDHADLESSLHNGTEDSLVTGDGALEGLVTEPAAIKKRKKKHKNTSAILD